MPPSIQSQIAVVLVRARNPLNIGAAARAMGNFGFADLRVVNDYDVPFQEARSAVDAAPVLAAARQFASLAEAVADCTLVVGTTALGERRLLHPVDLLRDAVAPMQQAATAGGRVALLFGSEKTGLSAEEMSHCHRLMTVPMRDGGISMNLGQAVAVCLYELAREAPSQRVLPEALRPASGAESQRFEALLREVLVAAEYDRRFPGNMGDDALHRLVRRLALPGDDVEIWLGMLRQMLWRMRKSDIAR
ncbi:MAG: RNA methyltransferase [Janthinobacterium lividum]